MGQHVVGPRRALVVAAAVGTAGLLLAACGTASTPTTPSQNPNPTPSVGTVFDKAVPADVAHLPLVDQDGQTVTLASFAGKTVVLADFLTLCQEICPLTSANLAQVQAAVQKSGASKQVEILEVTVDPQRDTPQRLAAYQKLFGTHPNWSFLTGSPAQVAALWKAFGVEYEKDVGSTQGPAPRDWMTGKPVTYDVSHQDAVFILGPDGHEKWVTLGNPDVTSPDTLPSTLTDYLNDEGQANLASPPAGSWTAADVEQALAYVTKHPVGQ